MNVDRRRLPAMKRKHIYAGKIVDLIVDTVESNGKEYLREVVRHPGGVVVLVELNDGRIVFVRQSRYPMNQELLELPAGKLDPGEDPEATAARELEEETGLRPEYLTRIYSYYLSPGFCDELLHFYYTHRVEETVSNPDEDEEITVEFHSLEEALEMSARGEIIDAKTLVALLWLHRKRVEKS